MSCLLWNNDDYCVQIPSIDYEHKILVAMVNEIDSAMQTQGPFHTQIILDKLANLSNGIKNHFASEERFLLINNYPEYDTHKSEHTILLERLNMFESRFKLEEKAFSEKMLLFLKDWLVRHIILHDRKFGHYFKDKEVSCHYD
jgi:hemerythrin-like metal-binding protein